MTIVKPAQASGNVYRTSDFLWCSHEINPATCIYPTKEAACAALAATNPAYNYNPFVVWSGGDFTGYSCYGNTASHPNEPYYAQRLGWLIQLGACPSNSASLNTTSCTCNTNFVPDSTGTSCVPANNCPANMTGTPCACIAGGYVLNPNGAGCVLEQYALSLVGMGTEIEPSSTRTGYVSVMGAQTNQPKGGAVVRITVGVDVSSGGHDHGDNPTRRDRGSISGCAAADVPDAYDCTTASNGYAQFTFDAPEASGTHNFTATCVHPACTNSEPGHIDVKVDGLWPIPESDGWVLIQKPGAKHGNGHYLSTPAMQQLWLLAGNYNLNFPNNSHLYLNDASLIWGGRFDKNGDWASPHDGHRRGVVIDVRANDDTGATGAIPLSSFQSFITMAAKHSTEAQVHCTSNKADGQNRHPPTCTGADGSQDTNRHFHILLLGVDQ
jgi:hypothetical protein